MEHPEVTRPAARCAARAPGPDGRGACSASNRRQESRDEPDRDRARAARAQRVAAGARVRGARRQGPQIRRRSGGLTGYSRQAVDVEHAARGVIVRVPLRCRDPSVDGDRALPVGAADRQHADLTARGRQVHADAAAPLDVEQAAATPGLVPPLPFDQASCRVPLRSRHAAVPLWVARKTQLPRQVAGSEKRSVGPGTWTVCSSPPVSAFTPARRESESRRSRPSLPPWTNPPDEQRRRRRAEVEIARVQLRLVLRRPVGEQPLPVGRQDGTLSPQLVEPSNGPLPVATRRSPLPGSTTGAEPPQIAESLPWQVEGWMISCRSEQSEFQTRDDATVRRIEGDDVALVGRRVADVAVGRREHRPRGVVQRRRRASRGSGHASPASTRSPCRRRFASLRIAAVGRAGVDRRAVGVGDRGRGRDLRRPRVAARSVGGVKRQSSAPLSASIASVRPYVVVTKNASRPRRASCTPCR